MIVHFYQVMKDCQTSLQCKYFFNHLIGFTQLPPSPSHTLLFSRSPTAINYIYRFSIYLLIRWRIERRQTDAHRSRGLFATSRPSRRRHCARLPSADGHHHCLRRTPERQVVHCANIFAFRLRFSLLSLLFFFIIFSFFFLCFYHNKNNHKSFGLFCIYALQSICALGTRMRWGEILQVQCMFINEQLHSKRLMNIRLPQVQLQERRLFNLFSL